MGESEHKHEKWDPEAEVQRLRTDPQFAKSEISVKHTRAGTTEVIIQPKVEPETRGR